MFKKRAKKEYPLGTFIPAPARVCAIIQLSLAFMIILWNISQPFMKELFTYKSHMLIYQDVMGISTSAHSEEALARQERNRLRFDQLSLVEKQILLENYGKLQQLSQRTFLEKTERSIQILTFEIPLYEQLWLLLSLILPILLLKRIDGAVQAIWLLPLLASIYSIDNYWFGKQMGLSEEAKLFPTEQVLINDYLKQPLDIDLSKQKAQLELAWKRYLVDKWTKLEIRDGRDVDQLAEAGEFTFNIARTKALPNPKDIIAIKKNPQKEPLFILALYVFWNFSFAVITFQYCTKSGKPSLPHHHFRI